ncbi:MAG: carboxymuconolactone decarboxylase family protein [Nitriliruptoraceae bacterium]
MSPGFAAVARHHPEVFATYAAYVDEVWASDALPPGTLELCRVRIAQLLGVESEQAVRLGAEVVGLEAKLAHLAAWTDDARFTDVDRVCLAFAEQFLLDTQALDDPTAEAVRERVGDAGLVTLALGVGLAEGMVRAAVALGERPSAGRYVSAADRAVAAGVAGATDRVHDPGPDDG